MPELPEVQTTVLGLQILTNTIIKSIIVKTNKLRYIVPKSIKNVTKKRKILRIYRIAKYIIIDLEGKVSIIFHLGMSGRLRLFDIRNYKILKHDHLLVRLSQKNILIFNDPRKFGFVDYCPTLEIKNLKYISKLGPDPFDKEFNAEYLFKKFSGSSRSVKQLLLDQKIISGIGNIYASEILYDAKISPFIPSNKIKYKQIDLLIKSTRKILTKAIKVGGSSLRNYVSSDGTLGNFQSYFKVYNREGQKILNSRIYKVVQNGRSTFYCPKLQKSKFNPISVLKFN